jgi:lipopolysaccharide/colanic/teichoic acid biosynthesis glycosyltransferase
MSRRGRGRAYCTGRLKRGVDLLLGLMALTLLSPLFLIMAVAIAASSGRPVLFRQVRIGLEGRPFRLLKFRTMRTDADRGLPITGSGDPRVTPLGRLLRASKLDELPQLVNVIRGEMSFVGPRPEVPRYVALYTREQRGVLQVRPGLTDPASVQFRDEEAMLGAVEAARRESYYVSEVLPRKLALNLQYVEQAGLLYDLGLIIGTIKTVLLPSRT